MLKPVTWMLITALIFSVAINFSQLQQHSPVQDSVWQNAPIMVLTNGALDGTITVGEARQNGSNGVFAYEQLDGEGVALNGEFFHVSDDGIVNTLHDSEKLVWVSLSEFAQEREISLEPGFSMADLAARIDPLLETTNAFYAVIITGEFDIQTRTFSKQTQPYPAFCDVEDVKFEPLVTSGTMVGFRGPGYVAVGEPIINVANWHLHFISDDHAYAGHVLSFTVTQEAQLKLDKKNALFMQIPGTPEFNDAYLDTPLACAP